MRDPVLIHLHVPKCAGGAVNQVMRRHFGDRLLHASREVVLKRLAEGHHERFDAVAGHLIWGVQSGFGRRTVCFSAVRDPIDRVCSFFNFAHTEPRASMHGPLKTHLRSLDDISPEFFQTFPALARRWGNAMCRTYTGVDRVGSMTWEEVWAIIGGRIEAGELVVRDLDGIRDFLVDQGVHEGGPLPYQKVTRHEAFDDYVVARPSALAPATIAKLTTRNQHDFRLMDALRTAGHIAG